MALALNDRVKQTGTANTTVSFTLSGASAGFQSFAVVGNGNTTYYSATDASGGWEVGIGTYSTTGPTLTRTTILSSSNSGSAVTFSGTVDVWVTYPSEKSVNQDASGTVNILTNVPNTVTNVGTLNVGDGTYNFAQLGQIATFASSEPIVNTVSVQNTSTSNTAYSSIQVGANNYNTGYYIELGTNSSTYSYAAAGYPNSSVNQPNVNYIVANKADLGIVTWDADDIHFIQNASTVATDSMTLYYDGGVSLGGLASPGIGNIACNNINLKFQQVVSSGGTTTFLNSTPYYTQVTGTSTQTIKFPDATTCLVGTTFVVDNDSTGTVTIKDGANTSFETIIAGSVHNFILEDNSTIAGTWIRYGSIPSTVDWGTNSLQLGSTTITGGTWNGGTIPTGYGGTGLTTFTGANNAIYSTSSSTLAAGTLPVAAGGTALTSFTSGGAMYATSTSALTTGTLPITAGGTGLTSTPANGALDIGNGTGFTRTTLTAGTGISITNGAGSISIASTITSGVTVTDDTTTATAIYPTLTSATSGSISGVSVTSTKFKFVPSTGTMTASNLEASNGMIVNSKTVSTNYSIPSGSNAIAVGPVTVASGAAVTIPSGSRWLVL